MYKLFWITILITLTQACNSPQPTKEDYSINTEKKVILSKEANDEFFYWEIDDKNIIWELELGEIPALQEYRDTLNLVVGESELAATVHKESAQNLDKALIEDEENGDKINALLVHSGSIGNIRPINNLESQILNYQINRYPLFSKPTEFHAFIAQNNKNKKIRVYFGGSDTGWPPRPGILIDELEKEENADWILINHLHNHFCEENENYVGILAPSLADAQYYKMLKERFNIDKASITNGFHTVEIESKDFEKFESH